MRVKKAVTLVLILMLALMTACGGGSASNETASNTNTSEPVTATETSEETVPGNEEPTSISMLTGVWGQPPVDLDNSSIFQKLEEWTNTDLDITIVPVSNYDQNLNLVMAANELPELVHAFNSKAPSLIKAINQGAFHDLSEFDLSQYPNLMEIPEFVWNNSKINGKIYGVPNPVGLNAEGMMIRKDWLETLQLQEPTTVEELKEVLIAFAKNDPDGNGKDDTYGLVGKGLSLLGAFGVHEPQFEGDMMLLHWMTSNYRDFLAYSRELYANGVMPKEYFLMKGSDQESMLVNGLAGARSAGLHSAGELTVEIQKKYPEASFMPLKPLKGPNGYSGKKQLGYYGMWLIPSSVDKEKVPKILEFLDKTATEEINNLMNFGIEGVHYNSLEGQKVDATEAQMKQFEEEAGVGTIVYVNKYRPYNDVTKNGFEKEIEEMLIASIDEHMELSPSDPFEVLFSETYANRYSDVFKDLDAMIIQATTGDISLEEWDAFVQKMKENPTVQQMMKEFKMQYDIMFDE